MSYPAPDQHHRPQGDTFGLPTGHPTEPAYRQPDPYARQPYGFSGAAPGPVPGHMMVPARHVPYGDLRSAWQYHDPRPPAPHAMPMAPSEQNTWGTLAHVANLVLGWVGALLVMVTYGERSEWVRVNARESLNFALTMVIGVAVSYLLTLVIIGLPLLIACVVMAIVFPIIAAVKASRGEFYRYPVAIPFFGRSR